LTGIIIKSTLNKILAFSLTKVASLPNKQSESGNVTLQCSQFESGNVTLKVFTVWIR